MIDVAVAVLDKEDVEKGVVFTKHIWCGSAKATYMPGRWHDGLSEFECRGDGL
jgi:hypothetical protein